MNGVRISRRALGVGGALAAAGIPRARAAEGTIDRRALVRRHNPVFRAIVPDSPLSVGNGEFAFTADVTGLQSLPGAYRVPLNSLSQWAWHRNRPHPDLPQELRLTPLDFHGRTVWLPIDPVDQRVMFAYYRANPHRLHLARVGLRLLDAAGGAHPLDPDDVREIEQTLDLWTGLLTSRFTLSGARVAVETCCHPSLDLLAISVESPLVAEGRLAISVALPAPDSRPEDRLPTPVVREDLMEFQTLLTRLGPTRARVQRVVDEDSYEVALGWTEGLGLDHVRRHELLLRAAPHGAGERAQVALGFSPDEWVGPLPDVPETGAAAEKHWERFWSTGGAVELAQSHDPRAPELERRIVLSQYQTAINCAGSLPPQETGLYSVSWHGKFHLEMHWWHAAHFALWDRLSLLERSLEWYQRILPMAEALAREQGFAGARWPKMVGPDGRQSPSEVAPLLIWQQPHPIAFAELCYQALPSAETLERYREIVFQTADFMASFAHWDGRRGQYVLGPPIVPAQEVHDAVKVVNPTFEVAYWVHGLELALAWRRRLGLPAAPEWERVARLMAPLPQADGVYVAHENAPETFERQNRDHPSMLGAMGVLPGARVDPAVMRRTLRRVLAEWRWKDRTWGWDYPLTAMTAARLEEPHLALDALLMDSPKNHFLPNGHSPQADSLPAYLPSNGGLLAAVALMVAGWQGRAAGSPMPGFPADGSWAVKAEGLNAWL